MSATLTRPMPTDDAESYLDAEWVDVGYSSLHTGDDWPTLLRKVLAEGSLTEIQRQSLRAGWDAAQADVEAFARDMAAGADVVPVGEIENGHWPW
jgi:hypothetical protein